MANPQLWLYIKLFWKTAFMIIYPLILLPVFIIDNIPEKRCLYLLLLMAGFWIFEILPLAITSLFPVVLLPLMGIMSTNATCMCYFKEANMMFVGGLIVALAVEYCDLHTRISLNVIKIIGCSYRRLSLGFSAVTMFVSMWISNTGATAMMIPIIEATLTELEKQGIGRMYKEDGEAQASDDQKPDLEASANATKPKSSIEEDDKRRPTSSTMCFFIGTAYSATIGGMGTLVGSGTNLALVGIYETFFFKSPGMEFTKWMLICVPMMLVMMGLTWLWLQIWFMGLFRPNSKDAKDINVGTEGAEVARGVIKDKLHDMGPWTCHQILTAILFVLVVALWFFLKPKFIRGWAKQITDADVKSATPAIFVVILLFILPANKNFFNMWSKDDESKPKAQTPALLTWGYIQKRMHWSLVFLMGGGFALAEGARASNMTKMIADSLENLVNLPQLIVLIVSCLLVMILTQIITSNVAIANIVMPIIATMCTEFKIHPIYLMLPVGLSCSFAFCLPTSTPPNGIAAIPCNMRVMDMIKVGLGVELVAFVTVIGIFPWLGGVIWDFNTFPAWANVTMVRP